LKANLCFAYLPKIVANTPDSEVEVEVLGQMMKGKVLANPPVLTHAVKERKEKKEKKKKMERAAV